MYLKFTGKTYQEALIKMKSANLPKDTKIINTQTYQKYRFFGLIKKNIVEITVKLPEKEENLIHKPTLYPKTEQINLNQLFKEIIELKTKVNHFYSHQISQHQTVPLEHEEIKSPKLIELKKYLLKSELNPELAKNIIFKINRELPEEELENKEILNKKIKEFVSKYIKITGPITIGPKKPKIVFLVGPPGDGKTTTIVKLGAIYAKKQPVSFFTIDMYKLGAIEQLKAFVEIMRMDFKIIYDKNQLKSAIKQCDNDLILVDTVGRGPNMPLKLSTEIKNFIDAVDHGSLEVHLVISATTKESDLYNTIEAFSKLNYDRIILTKLDQAVCIGNVINVLEKSKKPVSYITFGQEIPDDISIAEPEILANWFMRDFT